jgi:hypothetical protein
MITDPLSIEQALGKYVYLKMVVWPKHVAQLNKYKKRTILTLRRRKTLSPRSHTRNTMQTPKIKITVGMTGYGLNGRGVGIRISIRVKFLSYRRPARFWGRSSPFLNGYGGGSYFFGVNRPGPEAGHSLWSSADPTIRGSTSIPPYLFMT